MAERIDFKDKFDALDKGVEDAEKKAVELGHEINALWVEYESQIKDWQAHINGTHKVYKAKAEVLERQKENAEKRASKLVQERVLLDASIELDAVRKKGRIETTGDISNFMRVEAGRPFGADNVQKAPLKNGIVFVRQGRGDDRTVRYLAMHGLRVVGFYYCEKADHIGDYPTYESWVGVKKLTTDNMVKVKKMLGYSYVTDGKKCDYHLVIPSFRQWKAHIEKLDARKLDAVDLKDENNIKKIFQW